MECKGEKTEEEKKEIPFKSASKNLIYISCQLNICAIFMPYKVTMET